MCKSATEFYFQQTTLTLVRYLRDFRKIYLTLFNSGKLVTLI